MNLEEYLSMLQKMAERERKRKQQEMTDKKNRTSFGGFSSFL